MTPNDPCRSRRQSQGPYTQRLKSTSMRQRSVLETICETYAELDKIYVLADFAKGHRLFVWEFL